MGKKISAKALASLYPSTQWRTRNVINSAVTKVQKAHDEEFMRLQSVQQTYQAIMKFGKAASEAGKSFKQAKLAGYEGNMLNYAKEPSEAQGVWEDRYKTYNKKVMDSTNNELTLDKLFKTTQKRQKGQGAKFKLDKFSEKMRLEDEKGEFTDDESTFGLNTLLDYYEQSKKETPELVELSKEVTSIKEDEYDLNLDANEPFADMPYDSFEDLDDLSEAEAQEGDIEGNEEYWDNAQKFADNENFDFDFNNPEDRLEWADKLSSLSKEDRFKVYQDIKSSEDREARVEKRKEMAGEGDEYIEDFDRMYDVIETSEKAPGIKGLMQRMVPGGKSGYDTDAEFTLPHGGLMQLPPPFALDTYEYKSRPTKPGIPISGDEDFGEAKYPDSLYPSTATYGMGHDKWEALKEQSWPKEQEGPPVPYPEQLGTDFFDRRINATPYEIPSSFGLADKPIVAKGLIPGLSGFQRQYEEQIRKRRALEELYK